MRPTCMPKDEDSPVDSIQRRMHDAYGYNKIGREISELCYGDTRPGSRPIDTRHATVIAPAQSLRDEKETPTTTRSRRHRRSDGCCRHTMAVVLL